MMDKKPNIQDEMIMSTMSQLVPKEHLLRKVDSNVDFKFIYKIVEDLYSDVGRRSVDPVVLFKLVLIQHIFGIKSMRQTIKDCEVNVAYRWFLGIPFSKTIPHFSTFSKNYERRFKDTDTFEQIFVNILHQAIDNNLVGGEEFFTDSTHIKANANKKKFRNEVVNVVQNNTDNLLDEINEERTKIGKKPLVRKIKNEDTQKNIKVSTTDPESGYYHRSHKEEGFMYLDHRTVDGKFNIIVDAHVTPGNVHDSKPYIERMQYLRDKRGLVPQAVALDSGYSTREINAYLEENKIFSVIAYRRFPRNKKIISKNYFNYDNIKDEYICPNNKVLPLNTIRRNGYRVYKDKSKCINCPMAEKCVAIGSSHREITRHINEDINDRARERRISEKGKKLYAKRKETVELSFADSKQNHGYRYAPFRGLKKNQDYAWILCSVQNIKKISLWKQRMLPYVNNIEKTAKIHFTWNLAVLL